MLTPTAAWLAAMGAGQQVRYLLTLTHNDATTVKALSGSCNLFAYEEGLSEVGNVSSEVDMLTRATTTSACTLKVQDAWARPWIVAKRWIGQKANVKIGCANIAEADFLDYFTGTIEEIVPVASEKMVQITIGDIFAQLHQINITGAWFQPHPLEAIYKGDGTGILERSGISAALIDTASLDPDTAPYADIDHWVVSRIGDWDMYEQTAADEAIAQICQLLYGQLVTTEDGLIRFVRFDASAAAVDSWDKDDIIAGSLEQQPIGENVVNRVTVTFGGNNYSADDKPKTLQINDSDSQTAFAYPGLASRVFEYTFDTTWIGGRGCGSPYNANLEAGVTSFPLSGGAFQFCGTREKVPGPQPTNAPLAVARPGWYMVHDKLSPTIAGSEVIKATALTFNSMHGQDVTDPGLGTSAHYEFYNMITLSGITRGQLGTTDQQHIGTGQGYAFCWCSDITILVALAESILLRHKYGCPVVNLKTTMNKFPVQRGDLVTLTFPEFLDYGFDGVTTAVKFEVLKKEPDPSSNTIGWTLGYAGTSATNKFAHGNGAALGQVSQSQQSAQFSESAQPFVSNGLAASTSAGLVGKIGKGSASATTSGRSCIIGDVSHTFTASKDTYVSVDATTRHAILCYHEVANGAAVPPKPASETWIAKVVTNGAAITSITDLRNRAPVTAAHTVAVDKRSALSKNVNGMHRSKG